MTQLRRCPSLPHFSPLGGLGRPRPRMGDLCGLCPACAMSPGFHFETLF